MIIKGKEFLLRHIKMSDLVGFFECQNNEETRRGFMNPAKNLKDAKKKLLDMLHNMKKKESDIFAIIVNERFAGFIGLHHMNKEYFWHKCEVSYCIHPDFRGRGLASSALKLLVNYSFKKYPRLVRIEGWCRTFNKASARVLEKAGFKLEGILKKNKCKNGKYLDDMVWARVR